jgi:hypothetical protein
MPHDAALYMPSASSGVPARTTDKVKDEVQDAQVEYRQTAQSSFQQYKYLTTGVAPQSVPVIVSFNPATKPKDPAQTPFSLIITGTGFTAASKVWWNGTQYTPSGQTATTLTVTVPASDDENGYTIYVVNDGVPSDVENYKFT